MLTQVLPEGAFYYAKNGPAIIMTDNCDELRRSLHRNWPNATLLLCVFHVLQQVWRWLFERQHGVSKDHRVEIMKLFRKLVYAHDVEGYEKASEKFFLFRRRYKNTKIVYNISKNCVKLANRGRNAFQLRN